MELTYFEKVCGDLNLVKLGISSNPSYVTKDKMEGVEFFAGTVKPFIVKDFSRVYGELPSTQILNVLETLKDNGHSNNSEHSHKDEQKEEKQSPVNDTNNNNSIAIIPDQMTKPLIEKWKSMTTFDRMLMFQKTPPTAIEYREAGAKTKVPYVKGNYMLQEANIAFLFDWTCGIDQFSLGDKAVSCYGWIEVNLDGKRVRRSCVGVEEINQKVTKEHAMKSAHTDMIKKGLSLFGFNGDVYRGEV